MKDIIENFKIASGQVPGGIYAGLSFIPGDPDGEWEIGRKSTECPACTKGFLYYFYQKYDDTTTYYKVVCTTCNYTDDAGRMMTEEEKRQMRQVYCKKVKAMTFNRTGRSCNFVVRDGDMVDVCSLLNECDDCSLPY